IEGKFVFNPTYAQRLESDLDIIVSGTSSRINMLEAGAKILPEDVMGDAIEQGFNQLKELNDLQEKIAKEFGKPKQDLAVFKHDPALVEAIQKFAEPKLDSALFVASKQEHYAGQ